MEISKASATIISITSYLMIAGAVAGVLGVELAMFPGTAAAAVADTTPGSVETTSSSNFFLFIAR